MYIPETACNHRKTLIALITADGYFGVISLGPGETYPPKGKVQSVCPPYDSNVYTSHISGKDLAHWDGNKWTCTGWTGDTTG